MAGQDGEGMVSGTIVLVDRGCCVIWPGVLQV